MVTFWPWRAESSSTASFEKTLSTLSVKITDTQTSLDKVRANSRRARVLWTLYLSFAYLVYAIVLILVVGYKNLGTYEWTGLAGGPVVIYATRTTLATFYNFRIESLSSRLKDHQQERAKTIKKLKDATKYDSTLELIEKYGGEGRSKGNSRKNNGEELGNDGNDKRNKKNPCPAPSGAPNRTRMPPPATANIPRPGISSSKPAHSLIEPGAEFAPNAEFSGPLPTFPVHQGPSTPGYFNAASETHWYDRIFDVLLGEDETAPKNRIVLICQSCRLINGQAPPGTKTLSELGSWKCMSCGATNGEMDEGKRIVNEVLRDAADTVPEMQEVGESSSDDAVEIEPVTIGEDDGPAAVVKKRRGNGKK